MNKKELAKLLFQHKDIKSLFESRQFDASTLKKVISEEIMREAEGDGWKSDNSEETKAMIAQIKDLTATLNEFKIRLSNVKQEKRTARANNDREAVAAAQDEKKQIDADIDRLGNRIKKLEANLAIAYERAGETQTKEDDKVITSIASKVKDTVATADQEIAISDSRPDLQQKTVRDTNAKLGTAIRTVDEIEPQPDAVKAAQNTQQDSAEETVPKPETTPQTPAGKGWGRADVSIRGAIKSKELTLENIKESLKSVEAFKKLFNITGDAEPKFAQAREKFDTGWIAGEIRRLQEIAEAAATTNDLPQEEMDNAANTIMSFYDYMKEKSKGEQQFQIPSNFQFPSGPAPASEKEFKKEFIAPIEQTQGTEAVEQDYLAIAEQVIAQAPELLSAADLTVKGMKEFIGWYVAGRSTGSLKEGDGTSGALAGLKKEFSQRLLTYSGNDKNTIIKYINTNTEKWNGIFTKLDELVKTGKIKINKSDEPVEDSNKETVGLVTKEMAQQVIEETPKVDPAADGDQSPLATEEMDAAWATTLNAFFGKDPTRSSFMRQFLLKNQASMLYGMIDVLGQIITGGAGDEERAYTGEKTQVKQKEEPVTPPAEAEKEKETSKTDTTSTDTSTDEEENNQVQIPESLEEQVINEIFGMFGGKDKEDKEIKFSPKSTSLMRQDLEAMVDLLRSLKTDIGQYKKYSTSSSVDPRFDGSTLKRAMDAKLKVVQQSIAHLTKVIDLEVQSQKDQLKADGAQAGQDTAELQEASGSDRKVRIAEVEKVYNRLRELYLKGLKVSLSKNQPDEAKSGAEAMKDYVMGEETFMSYFPSNIITSSGGVMTLGGAHKSMVDIIAPFIETIRDIVTITKTQKVSESNLQTAILDLDEIAKAIESMFKVPSLIDREFMKKYIEAASQDPAKQSLTDEKGTVKTGNQDVSDFTGDDAVDGINDGDEVTDGTDPIDSDSDDDDVSDGEQSTTKTANTGGNYFKNFSGLFSKIKNWLISKELQWPKFSALFEKFKKSKTTLPEKLAFDSDSMSTELGKLDDDKAAVAWLQDLESNGEWLETLNPIQIPPLIKFSQKLKDLGNLTEINNAATNTMVVDLRELGFQITPEQFNDTLDSFEGKEKGLINDTISESPKESSSFIYHFIKGTYVSAGEKNGEDETEEDSDSTTPPVADQFMSVRLGYESPQDLEDKFKPQFKKIMQKLDLEFRPLDGSDKDNPVSAIDYSSGLFLDIAKLVAKSTAKSSIQEGFGEKIKSWNRSRAAKKDSKNRSKLAKQIVKQSFPKVSTEAELGEDSVGQLVLEFIESFTDDSSDVIKTLMKVLGDNEGDIPKTLAKLKSAEEMEDFYNRIGPDRLSEALRPIIEKMLNEHYNH